MYRFIFLIFLLVSVSLKSQNRKPYPNETDAKEFVKWLTTEYWDTFDLNYTLDDHIGSPSKSWFIVDSSSYYSTVFTGQLKRYFDTFDIHYFFAQIDSFKQEFFIPDSLIQHYLNLNRLDTLSEDQIVQQFLEYKKTADPNSTDTPAYNYKWSHEFLNTRIQLEADKGEHSFFNHYTTNYLSYPLFNLDKTIAVIDVCMFCGPLCAWGTTFVFEKTNNGWKKIHMANVWVS
jgi:hypothetical protein